MLKLIYAVLLITVLLPFTMFANGGDQRVADGYLVNLSRAPFTPIAGIKTAILTSFVDLKTGQLIKDDILVSVRIAEGRGSKSFIHEKRDIPVKGGILEYSYIFQNAGMHEIFFNFIFANDPTKQVHELPDFLIDVQKPVSGYSANQVLIAICGSFIIGLIAGWFVKRIVSSKTKYPVF